MVFSTSGCITAQSHHSLQAPHRDHSNITERICTAASDAASPKLSESTLSRKPAWKWAASFVRVSTGFCCSWDGGR